MNRYLLTIIMIACCATVGAQTSDRDYIRLGNAAYRQNAFNKAEVYYTKAVEKKPSAEAYFNLGNALTMQQQDSTAFQRYMQSLELVGNNNLKKAKIYHNMGNLQYASRNYQDAVELYKASLRCNPNDNETRYNLAMAQHMLKNNPNNGGGGGNSNQDNKDQEDKKQEQQDKQQSQQQQQKKNQQEMSQEAADQLLNSAQQDEKNVQRKVNEKQTRQPRRLQKDW